MQTFHSSFKMSDFGKPITRYGSHMVQINGQHICVTELDDVALMFEWRRTQRILAELYAEHDRLSKGLRGMVLRLLGIKLSKSDRPSKGIYVCESPTPGEPK